MRFEDHAAFDACTRRFLPECRHSREDRGCGAMGNIPQFAALELSARHRSHCDSAAISTTSAGSRAAPNGSRSP